jgi:FkbM family methyltransferase
MKSVLKTLLASTLGSERAGELIRRIRRRPLLFSEAELILRWFDQNPRPGVMVDVGAHFGESFSPYLARGWRIHAFEPDPDNRARLRAAADVSKISLHEMAVSDHEADDIPFFASPESTGISSLSAFRKTHREVNRVRLATLRTILKEQGETRVDFLKIDAEGHDLFVLRGFPWDCIQPDVILCEFEDRKTEPLGYRFDEMARYIENKGYKVFVSEWTPIIRYGVEHHWRSWKPFPCTLIDPSGWGNLVAFKTGLRTEVVANYVSKFKAA